MKVFSILIFTFFSLQITAQDKNPLPHFLINIYWNGSSFSTNEIKQKLTQKFSDRGCRIEFVTAPKSWLYLTANAFPGLIELVFRSEEGYAKGFRWYSETDGSGASFNNTDGDALQIIDLMFDGDYRSFLNSVKCE
jgi:hypothetical protein